MPGEALPYSPQIAAQEALDYAAELRAALVDDKALARAVVLAKAEYEVADYVVAIMVRDKARAMLRAVGQAIRTGLIPAGFDRDNGRGQLITTGLQQYDPRIAFQASLRTAYAAGREERIARDPENTHKLYRSMRDSRVRDSHRKLDGLVLPVEDPIWDKISAPNGWRCRCKCYGVNQTGIDRLEARGVPLQKVLPDLPMVKHRNKATGEVETLPMGVEPGWGTKPGSAANLKQMAKMLTNREKMLADSPLADM